jgi:hypothetical protein
MPPMTRRTLLAGLAALASPALAQPVPAFSSVSVDVGHLKAIGVGPMADLVRDAMTDELRRVFADRIGGRGPRLVVRLTTLHLTAFANAGRGLRGSASDSIEGEALVVGARGEVLARYPQIASQVAYGAWYDPDAEWRRAERVARTYARWLPRTVSLPPSPHPRSAPAARP